jgi:signal-transduction protein with cAMP-binding, CBS, and nucleotidyltransferase domain
MIASELISDLLTPLMTSDTGEESLTLMSINHIKHLPIVNDKMLLGVISDEDILSNDLQEPIGSYNLSLSKAFVYENEHLFEIMSRMAASNLTTIPVIDFEENYLGLITQENLLQFYASSFSFTEPGSILVLETSKTQYSLAEISRIVESENGTILSSFLTSEPDSTSVLITLKINRQDINHIIKTFQRYDYLIKGSFTEKEYVDGLKERYDSLMSYLNV